MRRQWYLGFLICLFFFFSSALLLEELRWFLLILIPLIFLWAHDVLQTKHALLRNFPVLGHMRYFFEFIRPEIQQYFIASDTDELPFNRESRSLVYQRAKNTRDTIPFGTENDIYSVGYTWALHSITPKPSAEVINRIWIGGPECKKPYHASLLNVSAMSFGALSAKAIMAINKGAQIGGFAHNTGEGGLSTYHLQGGDLIFQIGTAYFGCRDNNGNFSKDEYQKEALRDEVKMIELKLSQGAKPSHGGILPASKLTEEIAKARKVPMGQDVLSPIAHSAFSTPIGLLEFIKLLRDLSGGKPTGFKLCVGRHDDFLSICKAMLHTNIYPDFITVDGAEGGTGATPVEFSNYIGSPLESGLIFVHNALVGINARDKVKIICSGKITNGFDMLMHIAIGADLCNSARGMMMATGCIQSKQCNANTCPTGIATQNQRLQYGLVVDNKKINIANFHKNTLHSFQEIVGALGIKNPDDLKPSHILRRVDVNDVRSFDAIYEYLEPGQLLTNAIPDSYKKDWHSAKAECFPLS